ncbi:sulfotransferase [Mesorhizobium sp. PL10]
MSTRLPPAWSKHLKGLSGPKASPVVKAKPLPRSQADDLLLKQALEFQQAKRLPEAEELCHRVLARTPNNALALYILGTLGIGFDNELSIKYFERAVSQDPQNPYFHLSLGDTYLKVEEYARAIMHLRRASELKPDLVEAFCSLGLAHLEFGQADSALSAYERALEINRDHPLVRTSLASALISVGRMDEAAAHLKESIEHRLDLATAYSAYIFSRKFTEEPPEFASMVRELSNPNLDPASSQQLHRAAGKVLNDLRRYEDAMDHFHKAKENTGYYDLASYRGKIDSLIRTFSPENAAPRVGYGDPSEIPVFVLGMPRSGTTLTEQICSSHPDVHGVGEIGKLRRIALSLGFTPKSAEAFNRSVRSMTAPHSRALAEDYLSYVRQMAPNALRIIDKRTHNFELIGFIATIFPNARIIHCRRDAIDTCLSCFTSNINQGHTYITDLTTLGLYYREYDRLMRHWKAVFPGRIFENRYEDMISDQEGQSRRLIDYLGLEWNDTCLRFFDKDSSVRTASSWQVRQPVYKSSVKRWRDYGSKIQPLIAALGDLAEV